MVVSQTTIGGGVAHIVQVPYGRLQPIVFDQLKSLEEIATDYDLWINGCFYQYTGSNPVIWGLVFGPGGRLQGNGMRSDHPVLFWNDQRAHLALAIGDPPAANLRRLAEGFVYGMSGGPPLVAQDRIMLDPGIDKNRYPGTNPQLRQPRTAIGVRTIGAREFILVRARSATLMELAQWYLKNGYSPAMALDGGSSSQIVLHQRVVEGTGRPVRVGLGVPRITANPTPQPPPGNAPTPSPSQPITPAQWPILVPKGMYHWPSLSKTLRYHLYYPPVPTTLQVQQNFWLYEFACKGTGVALVAQELIDGLQLMRNLVSQWRGVETPFTVNSGYRAPSHNERIGGVKDSLHTRGLAADIAATFDRQHGVDLLYRAAKEIGFGGIGRYYHPRRWFVHVDLGPQKQWTDNAPQPDA